MLLVVVLIVLDIELEGLVAWQACHWVNGPQLPNYKCK